MKSWQWFLVFIFVAVGSSAIWIYLQIPSDKELKGCLTTKMYQVKLCPGGKDYVPLSAISSYLQKATIISEDAAFWTHQGFDWDQIEKSAKQNWEDGSYRRGGSTITQQLAKNMFLSKEKSLFRKGIEAMITMRMEKVLKKREILERYLNVVEFGKNIFGVKSAASFYFKKSAANLDLAESAFLVMLLPSPVKYSRSFQKKELTPFARKRLIHIISDLGQTGQVTPEESQSALSKVQDFFGVAVSATPSTPETEFLDEGDPVPTLGPPTNAPAAPVPPPEINDSDGAPVE